MQLDFHSLSAGGRYRLIATTCARTVASVSAVIRGGLMPTGWSVVQCRQSGEVAADG